MTPEQLLEQLTERVVELEVKVAFHERELAELRALAELTHAVVEGLGTRFVPTLEEQHQRWMERVRRERADAPDVLR